LKALSEARPGAGSSPYVIAMTRMQIPILPHIVNALVLTAIFSAGNSYVYCRRSEYTESIPRLTDPQAPAGPVLGSRSKAKCPKYSLGARAMVCPYIVLALPLPSLFWVSEGSQSLVTWTNLPCLPAFLQVSNNAAVVLQWFVNLVTASQLLNYAIISFTYLKFYYVGASQLWGVLPIDVRTGTASARDTEGAFTPSKFLAAILRVSDCFNSEWSATKLTDYAYTGTMRLSAHLSWRS
jgi:amino acid transporter